MKNLVSAIEEKYAEENHRGRESGSWVIYVPKQKPKPGEQELLRVPSRLTMEDYSISEAGDADRIKDLCGSVCELDLTKNCLTDWNEVVCILESMPEVSFLNLTKNPLDCTTLPEGSRTFPGLTNLVLNATGVSWGAVARLMAWFPCLKELHLSLMDYTSVDLPQGLKHDCLKTLYLNECNISDWAEISKLGHAFPSLEYLNLIKINIKGLSDSDQYCEFSALKCLNISGTDLQSWDEIDKFRHFPSLTHVRLSGITCLQSWEAKQRRQHIISRLPNICMLNASPISETEREDAERAFIRFFMDQRTKPARFKELEAKHGKLDPLVAVRLDSVRTYKIPVRFEDKEEIMEIGAYTTMKELKKLLTNFTGLQPSKFKLDIHRIFQGQLLDISLAKLDKQLYQLNFKDDDMFVIQRK